jgi:hypothetical protein
MNFDHSNFQNPQLNESQSVINVQEKIIDLT